MHLVGKVVPAAVNLRDTLFGGVADLRRMPRDPVAEHPAGAVLYRYRPVRGAPDIGGTPVLLVPPLGAPDFAYDLRRGCSLVEHLLDGGRVVYLVDYGNITFADRRRGMEDWVDDVVPWAARGTGGRVHLVAWSLGGIFALLAVAAAAQAGDRLPVDTVTAIGSPIDISAVPLVAPLRPLAVATGGRGLSLALPGDRRDPRAAGQCGVPAHGGGPARDEAAHRALPDRRPRRSGPDRGRRPPDGQHARLPGPGVRPDLPPDAAQQRPRRRHAGAAAARTSRCPRSTCRCSSWRAATT